MGKIIRTDCEIECPRIDAGLRAGGYELVLLPESASEHELAEAVREAELLLMCYTPVTKRIISNSKRLKGIVKYGVGIDAIDIKAAIAHRIPVVNIPDYAEQTVAEGAFTLMLALAKKLIPIEREMQSSGWALPAGKWWGSDISGKTVGIVGAGRIGRAFARMAGAGFGARVIGFNPGMADSVMREAGIEPFADLHAMISQCDFVSIHCVLNDDTLHLFDEKAFAAMKPGAFLINVSRGAIVDEAAMLEALQNNLIAGAGLDVYAREPLAKTGHLLSPLFNMDNVIMLPHLTFFTDEAMARLETETLERCLEILEGRDVFVKSRDPRLRAQVHGVRFHD